MLPRRKQVEPDESAGAPEWMVTFSDCMTLLLTFFVLLLSFSSFDKHTFRKLRIIFSKALPAVGQSTGEGKDAFLLPPEQIVPTEFLGEGSEKPTLARGWDDNLKEETESEDFRSRKVFFTSSNRIFWAKGTTISPEGRYTLATVAAFLKKVPGRVVISENGPGDDEDSERFGLPRSWEVIRYLTTEQGLDKRRFSISAASTMAQESFESDELGPQRAEGKRMLEIVLLERSICN